MNKADAYKSRKYEVMPYDPNWVMTFTMESKTIKDIFGDAAAAVEHIGSTAVPGMEGKPTIDILVLVNNLSDADSHIQQIQDNGFEFLPGYVMENSYLFRKVENGHLLMNVHIFPANHPHVKEMIAIRDYLRSHPDEVKKYSELKKDLYTKYPESYIDYRKHKDEYMRELMKRALNFYG